MSTALPPPNPADAEPAPPLVALHQVGKTFRSADGHTRPVLAGIDLALRAGEIVALLGPSGSGKSTLLRLIAGLIPADEGEVRFRGQPLYAPARGVAMVFQSFALFPWLTVQGNVELGLEALGVPPGERAQRAAAAIELIGLTGFEGALPRELSGGMRQRVGIARALVTRPAVLLMDEAFSALDVLTGERLREDILGLWQSGQLGTQAMLVVSHDIEEAVLMADRILVLAHDPGRLRAELAVPLPRPRDADSREVRALVDQVYALMTAGAHQPARGADGVALPAALVPRRLTDRLPPADVAHIEGLLDLLADEPFNGRADLRRLAEDSELSDAALLRAAHALALLGLAQLEAGDLQLTPLGRRYAEGGRLLRHELFGQQLLTHVPLAAHIRHSLEQAPSGRLPARPFVKLLADHLDPREAERVLATAIDWARHGEVFEYDFATGQLRLPTGEDEAAG